MDFTTSCITTNEQGYELINHGTILFPIAKYSDNININPVNWHWHDEFEAGIIREGIAVVSAGSQKITLTKGQGFFINSGLFHAAWACDSTDCILDSIVFHPRLIGSTVDSIFWQKYVQPILSNNALTILALTENLTWMQQLIEHIDMVYSLCQQEKFGYEFKVRENLSELFFILNQNFEAFCSPTSDKKNREEERIKLMLQYIHNNFFEEITADMIADSASISNTEALRCFHNIIGSTPIQYLKEYRIRRAAELLLSTNMKISHIAEKCGFQDMSYFAKTFKTLKGVTPKDFRTKTL